jgi:hypothetical protein
MAVELAAVASAQLDVADESAVALVTAVNASRARGLELTEIGLAFVGDR